MEIIFQNRNKNNNNNNNNDNNPNRNFTTISDKINKLLHIFEHFKKDYNKMVHKV